MRKMFLLFCLGLSLVWETPRTLEAQSNELQVGVVHTVLGCAVSGLFSIVKHKSFFDSRSGCQIGAVGGFMTFVGMDWCAKHSNACLPGNFVARYGYSVLENQREGREPFPFINRGAEFRMPLGPVELRYDGRLDARVLPLTTAGILYEVGAGHRFDLERSIASGMPVFTYRPKPGDRWSGHSIGGVISIATARSWMKCRGSSSELPWGTNGTWASQVISCDASGMQNFLECAQSFNVPFEEGTFFYPLPRGCYRSPACATLSHEMVHGLQDYGPILGDAIRVRGVRMPFSNVFAWDEVGDLVFHALLPTSHENQRSNLMELEAYGLESCR